jgi:hypothetical protein
MVARELKTFVLPTLLSGAPAGAVGAAIKVNDPLQALSLTGQVLRFDRPTQPATFVVEDTLVDERAIVSHDVRILLLRLLSGKNQTSFLATTVARALSKANLRLYPFHMPMLEMFVEANAEILGPEALAFSQRQAPAEHKQSYFAPDQLTDETWMLATPAVKASFIASRRASDPAAALALLEASWGAESADSRVRLLGTLRSNLSEGDAPFLTGLAKDRAPRVRELAQRLLARLPGPAGENPALRAVLERIKVGQNGLIFKKASLSLELPATVKGHGAIRWIGDSFGSLSLQSLADALSMPTEAMIPAAEKDSHLMVAMLIMATNDKRLDIVDTITGRYLLDGWEAFIQADIDELADYAPDMRQRWVELVLRPNRWTADTSLWMLQWVVKILDGPALDDTLRGILKSMPWQSALKDPDRLNAETVEALAVLCPASTRPALRTALTGLDTNKTQSANLFLDLMDSLEAPNA